MLKAGLTGSIAVGKSFVCDVFRELGCYVIDADRLARDVVKPDTPGLANIIKEFGEGVINVDGELDRPKMASIVFVDEEKRLLLNSIIHPLVFEEQNRWLAEREAEDPNGIAIVDAALMIESGGYKRFDKLIVVWCEPDIQLQRLRTRDGMNETDAFRRIASQMPQDEKKKFADLLIDTSGGFDGTRTQCLRVHSELKNLARN
ncbi:MAG TPA: dephospho-CoA kinase [Pyrinomonadaceae bacterium]|nr:dephospho-CoA kinase [Pyrinomonadaceae bacterium]